MAADASATHGKFIWCELITSDTAAAGRFYASVVGWQTGQMPMADGSSYHLFNHGSGDQCVAVAGMMSFPPELEGHLPPNWTGYVAVDDVDRTAQEFSDQGGRVQRAPTDIPGIGRFAVVADPHGAVICIMAPLAQDNSPPEPEPGSAGTVGWRELYAQDGKEALGFYSKVFGWTLDHEFDMGPMGVYNIFAFNGRPVGGIMTKPPHIPAACWQFYFTVEAINAGIDRVKNGGGDILAGPMEVPGGSWIAQARDPQGAHFALTAARR